MTALPHLELSLSDAIRAEINAELGRRRLSQAGFARNLGKYQQWVNRRLSRAKIEVDDLDEIAHALGIPIEVLVANARAYQSRVNGPAKVADASSARSSTDRVSDYGSEGSQILTLIPGGLSSDQTPSPSPCRLSLITHSG